MACLEMHSSSSPNQNSDHKGLSCPPPPPMSPRISFSNDFVESPSHSHHHHQQIMIKTRESSPSTPPSSDFEFSVTNFSMMSADELFFKGRLLPFKDRPTTLREELLVEDEDDEFSLRPPKGSTRWREILSLKKAHFGYKKHAKPDASHHVEKMEPSGLVYDHESAYATRSTLQEILNEGGSTCRDVEFRP